MAPANSRNNELIDFTYDSCREIDDLLRRKLLALKVDVDLTLRDDVVRNRSLERIDYLVGGSFFENYTIAVEREEWGFSGYLFLPCPGGSVVNAHKVEIRFPLCYGNIADLIAYFICIAERTDETNMMFDLWRSRRENVKS